MDELPIAEHKDEILKAIFDEGTRVICINGATGCGKSTGIPYYIYQMVEKVAQMSSAVRRGANMDTMSRLNIVVTQPRRIAATSLARRLSKLLGSRLGDTVGYQIRGDVVRGDNTRINYVTTGVLLQRLSQDPSSFKKLSHIVLDEVHERDMETDLLALIIRNFLLQDMNPKVKIIVMSATLEGELYARYFSTRPPIDCGILSPYAVKEVHLEDLLSLDAFQNVEEVQNVQNVVKDMSTRGLLADTEKAFERLLPAACRFIKEDLNVAGTTILVFLSGAAEIDAMYNALYSYDDEDSQEAWFSIKILYSKVEKEDQNSVVEGCRSNDWMTIVLATNIAESSITIPNVDVVIDFGQRRYVKYNPHKKIEKIQLDWISQASARQRKGRTGRTNAGTIYRFYTREFYEVMRLYDIPEMKRASLDKIVLKTKLFVGRLVGLQKPSEILKMALSPPEEGKVLDAIKQLIDMGALCEMEEGIDRSVKTTQLQEAEECGVTKLGLVALSLPCDMKLSRLAFFGITLGLHCEAAIIIGALSMSQDPISLPMLKIMKDVDVFNKSLLRSSNFRRENDDGELSEPIMLLNMFKKWLRYKIHTICTQDGSRMNQSMLMANFAKTMRVHQGRLRELEASIADLCLRMIDLTVPNEDPVGLKKLETLQFCLSRDITKQRSLVEGVDIDDLFVKPQQCFLVKVMLTGAFVSLPLKSKCKADSADGANYVHVSTNVQSIEEVDQIIRRISPLLPTSVEHVGYSSGSGKNSVPQVNVKITWEQSEEEPESPLLMGISHSCELFAQAFQGYPKFFVKQLPEFGESKGQYICSPVRNDKLKFSVQRMGFKPDEGNLLPTKKHNKDAGVKIEGWRNPVGFMCERRSNTQHLLVAHSVVEMKNSTVMARGVTLLPRDFEGAWAALLLCIFSPYRHDLQLMVRRDGRRSRISDVILNHCKSDAISLPQKFPVTPMCLMQVNDIRVLYSDVLKESSSKHVPFKPDIVYRLEQLRKYFSTYARTHDVMIDDEDIESDLVEVFREFRDKSEVEILCDLLDDSLPNSSVPSSSNNRSISDDYFPVIDLKSMFPSHRHGSTYKVAVDPSQINAFDWRKGLGIILDDPNNEEIS